MRRLKWLALVLAVAVMLVTATACDQVTDILDKFGLGDILPGNGLQSNDHANPNNGGTVSPGPNDGGTTPPTDEEEEIEVITISEALLLCGESGNITTERYYIRGIIETVMNPAYGQMRIKDSTGSIEVYGTYSADGAIGYADFEEKPVKGDEVLLYCILQNYNGKKEVKNARLIEFKSNAGIVDESNYTEMTIAEARAAEGDTLIKVDGVVAKITYANGMKPSGVYLVDETNSIYVYDGDIAGQVSVGNRITILGSKTYWVLESEQSAASKHGYGGCNQLEDAYLVSNDGANNTFDKSWITETTVKDIMDTPVSENITTTIFKVNALVSKVEGTGFTNYYFNDLDGITGSYTYTQCNGSDFKWIDEFDGKICTVYLSVINAKSTDSECKFRFLPIEIVDENYQFDVNNACQFAVKYFGIDQFASVYTADPKLELTSIVSSALLGFEDVMLVYTSSNEASVYFETENGVTYMHCGEVGEATVTITATHGTNTYNETITVTVANPAVLEAITVADAIATAPDTNVTVKGIVGPSLVNQNGFYLFGEDGSVIAVRVATTDELVGLEIGHEVILKGMRERYVKNDASTITGQTCIVQGEILVNNYGSHEYSTEKFITDITPAEFYALDPKVDYSTSVFLLNVKVEVVKTAYYTTLNVVSGSTKISLYSSSAAQYSWLEQFAGEEVTIEIAACNWNDKDHWKGCVLAVRTDDGKVMNTLNFDNY